MVFGMFKKVLKAGAKEIQADYSQNRDYLEAVCAASALVAAADGEIEDSERIKVVKVISNHPVLSKFYAPAIIEQTAETMFKRAKDVSGKQMLARELDDIKTKENGKQMAEDVYLIATDVAMADGELEPQEADVLKKIANRLGIDTSSFEF
jgi:tellurite resistance protein TerB